MTLKSLIKKILSNIGIIVMKRSSHVYLSDDESFRIAFELSGNPSPVVIDGGAHKGATVDSIRGFAEGAKLHCFEPDPVLFGELKLKYSDDANVKITQAALGERTGKAVFNINASRPTNSLLKAAAGIEKDLAELCKTMQSIEVSITSIDDYCETLGLSHVDIIKLDLQGYDYFALLGASKVLEQVQIVLVEVLFSELYDGCRQFPDILFFMQKRGFRLFTLSGIHYGSSDELLWADAIFVKEQPMRDSLFGVTN